MEQAAIRGLIEDFVQSRESEFIFEELFNYARSKGCVISAEDLYDITVESECLFKKCVSDKDLLLPRHVFFKGAQFRVTPLEEEVEGGFIVPGHRFMPFVSRDVFPPDAKLVLPDGTVLCARTVALPQELAMRFLLFFGSFGAIDYLISDHEKNADSLKPPYSKEVEVTVFDLRDYFATSGFRNGDSLVLTVNDWTHGAFSVEHVPLGRRISLKSVRDWSQTLGVMLEIVVDELGTQADCCEQLAHLIFRAEQNEMCVSLSSNQPFSFAAAMNMQEEIILQEVGDHALFWYADDDPVIEAALEDLGDPAEPESELDAYFQQLGLSVSEGEVEAYMRDALYHGIRNSDEVLARILAGRSLCFESAEEQEEFHDLWSVLSDEVRVEYVREDDACAPLRSRFLAINDQCLAAMRQLDAQGVGMEIVENPVFMEFSHLTSIIAGGLALFNLPEAADEASDDLVEMIPMIEGTVTDLIKRMLSGEDGAGEIYQLKVSLKGASPPIWRRILVPADMALIDLHAAIQSTMGWCNCHLHQFKQGRTCFLSNPDSEFMGIGGFEDVDSAGVRIGDLLQKEKQKIDYEYDFGDSWEHIVLLEKILEPEEGQTYPVCIKGKRACPPEDCGGLFGYYAILEKDESFMGAEIIEDYLREIGDPECFDLNEANARLKCCF